MTTRDQQSEADVGMGFGFDARANERKADDLKRISERLVSDSRQLRRRSAELCDKIMRAQSV